MATRGLDGRRLFYPCQEQSMSAIQKISLLLLVIGGLNWGLVGLFGFDLVAAIFGEMSLVSRVVYVLVGASAFSQLIPLVAGQKPAVAR